MAAQVIDINAERLARLARELVRQDIQPTRTLIKEGPCLKCSGAGLLRMHHGAMEPFFHDWRDLHKVDREQILICRACAGTGVEYREVVLQGEAG